MQANSEHDPVEPPQKNSFSYMFKQQLIQAWRPVPTTCTSVILYTVLTIFFVTLGAVMFALTTKQGTVEQRYDTVCNGTNSCTITFKLDSRINSPVYFYYGLREFYQNHRKYIKYRSTDQLEKGKQFTQVSDASDCGTKVTNADMGWTTSANGATLNANDIAFPCGLVAYSYFNDTYSNLTLNGTNYAISESNIAWPSDKSNTKNWDLSKQGIDIENEHWLVWLRPAVQKDFYKLWGKVNSDLPAGNYTMVINNNFPISFGEKWIQFSSSNVFGNQHTMLGIAYLVAAGVSFVLMVTFIILCIKERVQHEEKKRELGNRTDF